MLFVKCRAGEYASPAGDPVVILGDTRVRLLEAIERHGIDEGVELVFRLVQAVHQLGDDRLPVIDLGDQEMLGLIVCGILAGQFITRTGGLPKHEAA